MNKTIHSLLALAAAAAFGIQSARADDHRGSRTLRNTDGVVSLFLETLATDGVTLVPLPTDAPDSTLLWGSHAHTTLFAPDGHQLTWGEYKTAKATAMARTTVIPGIGEGTRVSIHASGLIPGGTYTIWVLVFDGPFPAGPTLFENLVGAGALGVNDGRANTFTASAHGEGNITAVMPPGILYMIPYDLNGSLLDEVEFHLVGVYHSDGKSYGPLPGYANHAEVQFGVPMVP